MRKNGILASFNRLNICSIARETLLLELARDSLGEELTTDDISKRELAVDKELIQLIQAACKADNIPRAVELTKLLHHTLSLDMAKKVAEFYRLVGLQEKIDILKTQREEEEDRLEMARNKRKQWLIPDPLPRHLPSVVSSTSRPDPLQDFGPAPPVYRPGLARAIPVVETTRFSVSHADQSSNPTSVVDAAIGTPVVDDPAADAPSVSPEGKRKRSEWNDTKDETDDPSKRRAVNNSTAFPSKLSEFFSFHSILLVYS